MNWRKLAGATVGVAATAAASAVNPALGAAVGGALLGGSGGAAGGRKVRERTGRKVQDLTGVVGAVLGSTASAVGASEFIDPAAVCAFGEKLSSVIEQVCSSPQALTTITPLIALLVVGGHQLYKGITNAGERQ